jgi:hypothetical protein
MTGRKGFQEIGMELLLCPLLILYKYPNEDGYRSQAGKESRHIRQSAGVMEWWSVAKYQIPSTKSQGVRCHSGTRCQVSGVREEKKS